MFGVGCWQTPIVATISVAVAHWNLQVRVTGVFGLIPLNDDGAVQARTLSPAAAGVTKLRLALLVVQVVGTAVAPLNLALRTVYERTVLVLEPKVLAPVIPRT